MTDVVSLMATATGMLSLAGKARVPAVAERAREITRRVFGEAEGLSPHEACAEVARVKKALDDDPTLRPRLTEFVPAEVMDALFVASDALEAAIGMSGPVPEILPVSVRSTLTFLRRRIARYVRCIVASADEEDPLSVQRMNAALAPLRALRLERARKTRRAAPPREGDTPVLTAATDGATERAESAGVAAEVPIS